MYLSEYLAIAQRKLTVHEQLVTTAVFTAKQQMQHTQSKAQKVVDEKRYLAELVLTVKQTLETGKENPTYTYFYSNDSLLLIFNIIIIIIIHTTHQTLVHSACIRNDHGIHGIIIIVCTMQG